MKITPELIETKDFKTSLRGYDKREVDIFLDEIIEEFEVLLKDKQKLREEKDILLNQLAHYKKIENELSETFLKAQESAEEIRAQAQADYDEEMKQAYAFLMDANSDVTHQMTSLEDKYNLLKIRYIEYRKSIKNDLKKQLEILEKDIVE